MKTILYIVVNDRQELDSASSLGLGKKQKHTRTCNSIIFKRFFYQKMSERKLPICFFLHMQLWTKIKKLTVPMKSPRGCARLETVSGVDGRGEIQSFFSSKTPPSSVFSSVFDSATVHFMFLIVFFFFLGDVGLSTYWSIHTFCHTTFSVQNSKSRFLRIFILQTAHFIFLKFLFWLEDVHNELLWICWVLFSVFAAIFLDFVIKMSLHSEKMCVPSPWTFLWVCSIAQVVAGNRTQSFDNAPWQRALGATGAGLSRPDFHWAIGASAK